MPTQTVTITAKQRAWLKAFQDRAGTDPRGLDHLEGGAMSSPRPRRWPAVVLR